jgi:hypothetical protein
MLLFFADPIGFVATGTSSWPAHRPVAALRLVLVEPTQDGMSNQPMDGLETLLSICLFPQILRKRPNFKKEG